MEMPGIQQFIYDAIMNCPYDIREEMWSNVVLSGGNTMFPGFAQRLERELSELAPMRVKIIAQPERNYLAWIGGSIVADLSTFQEGMITYDEYEEDGASIVHRRCYPDEEANVGTIAIGGNDYSQIAKFAFCVGISGIAGYLIGQKMNKKESAYKILDTEQNGNIELLHYQSQN